MVRSGCEGFADGIPEDLNIIVIGVPEVEGATTISVVSRAVVDDDPAGLQLLGQLIDPILRADPKAKMVQRLRTLSTLAKGLNLLFRNLDQSQVVVAALEKGDLALASPDRPHPKDLYVKLL